MLGPTAFTDRSNLLDELESAFKRDVVERTTFPMHNISVEIKYKMSDLEIALNNPPNQLPVTGYIQSERQKKLTLVTYIVDSKQIGVQLTVDWFGTTHITNGPDYPLQNEIPVAEEIISSSTRFLASDRTDSDIYHLCQ